MMTLIPRAKGDACSVVQNKIGRKKRYLLWSHDRPREMHCWSNMKQEKTCAYEFILDSSGEWICYPFRSVIRSFPGAYIFALPPTVFSILSSHHSARPALCVSLHRRFPKSANSALRVCLPCSTQAIRCCSQNFPYGFLEISGCWVSLQGWVEKVLQSVAWFECPRDSGYFHHPSDRRPERTRSQLQHRGENHLDWRNLERARQHSP